MLYHIPSLPRLFDWFLLAPDCVVITHVTNTYSRPGGHWIECRRQPQRSEPRGRGRVALLRPIVQLIRGYGITPHPILGRVVECDYKFIDFFLL
jgi:hypothetical protein